MNAIKGLLCAVALTISAQDANNSFTVGNRAIRVINGKQHTSRSPIFKSVIAAEFIGQHEDGIIIREVTIREMRTGRTISRQNRPGVTISEDEIEERAEPGEVVFIDNCILSDGRKGVYGTYFRAVERGRVTIAGESMKSYDCGQPLLTQVQASSRTVYTTNAVERRATGQAVTADRRTAEERAKFAALQPVGTGRRFEDIPWAKWPQYDLKEARFQAKPPP